jgi:hypothetical protein
LLGFLAGAGAGAGALPGRVNVGMMIRKSESSHSVSTR